MATNKWLKDLGKMEGAVDKEYDFFAEGNVLRFPTPSVNWIFGKGAGLPFGYSAVLWGKPKHGKSLLCNLAIGGLHAQDKNAIAIKFNTEMREEGQMADYWGIDQDRYIGFNVNDPTMIFDRIKNEILPMIQDGMPLKLIIIDSLKAMQGVKESTRESVSNHLIGDHAKTIYDGLKAILPVIRKHKIALICTEQVRANQEAGPYGPKEKMGGAWGEQHFFEYYIKVTKDGSADGKASLTGEKFQNDAIQDFKGNKDNTGRKIFVTMTDSSVGVDGRSSQFTLDYNRGLINTSEEVFELAKNLGLVERPNNRTYIMNGKNYDSKGAFLKAIEDDKKLSNQILTAAYLQATPKETVAEPVKEKSQK